MKLFKIDAAGALFSVRVHCTIKTSYKFMKTKEKIIIYVYNKASFFYKIVNEDNSLKIANNNYHNFSKKTIAFRFFFGSLLPNVLTIFLASTVLVTSFYT